MASTPPDKIDLHVARFTRAIDQCNNPAKLQELQRNLAYWQALKAAAALNPEA